MSQPRHDQQQRNELFAEHMIVSASWSAGCVSIKGTLLSSLDLLLHWSLQN
jgi:hypothetical protein